MESLLISNGNIWKCTLPLAKHTLDRGLATSEKRQNGEKIQVCVYMRKKTGQVLTVDYILPDCWIFAFVCNIVCKNNHFMCCMWVWSCGCVILDCTVCVDLDRRLFCHHFILLLSKRKAHFIKAGYWFLDTFWVLTKRFPLRRWSKAVKSSKLESDLIHGQTLYLVHVFSKIRCLLVQVVFLWLLCWKTISYSLTSGITKSYCSLFRGV